MNHIGQPAATGRAWRRWCAGVLSAGALAALTACGGGTEAAAPQASTTQPAQVYELGPLDGNPRADQRLVQIKMVSTASQARIAPRAVVLPALANAKAELAKPADGQPQQIGLARAVGEAADPVATAALLNWKLGADGRQRAAISLTSPAAKALRLGLRVAQLPPGTQLRVYAPDDADRTEIDGAQVLRSLQQNLDAGASGADAYTYWLPTVEGDTTVLEFELAPGMNPALLKVALPQLSHLKALPTEVQLLNKAASACNVDATCTSGRDDQMRAVASMEYVKGGNAYVCTGTLMNNARQDGTPYFLSANHCIDSQTVASSLVTYWNYRSSSCNATTVAGNLQRVAGGAQLLYTTAATDTTLLRLNGTPPSNAFFAGWNGGAVAALNASIFSIHHPKGDLQKFSQGVVSAYINCSTDAAGQISCTQSTASAGAFYFVDWSRGMTEGGSSGGALFNTSGQVIGQLFAGNGACSSGIATYGRFDRAYAALAPWLNPTTTPGPVTLAPVYRFYNHATAAHFYTNNSLERDFVIANMPTYQYEGTAYRAYNGAAAGTSPVFRFYNRETGVHFYTINAAERDWIIATNPPFQYEGPYWYAQTGPGNGASPLFRFYSALRRSHFYTMSEGERDYVRATYRDFNDEGVAYYAWLPQ